MTEINAILSAIGDSITGAAWYQMVKWPFWVLLFTVAAGGVYTARFGKKTLICQSISGALNLCGIYQAAFILYANFDWMRTLPYTLPFLEVTKESVAFMDVTTMDVVTLAPMLLRLMILQLLVDFVESLNPGGKTFFPGWIFSQIITGLISLSAYLVGTAGFSMLLPFVSGKYAIIPVVLVSAVFLLMLCGKVIFTVVLESGNPQFKTFYGFFTTHKVGSLLTVAALSFLITAAVFATLFITDTSRLVYSSTSDWGLIIILFLLTLSEYIFSMFYCGKKK